MAWHVKLLPTSLASIWGQVQVSTAPLPIQLPAYEPGKTVEDGPSACATAPTWETGGAQGFWIQPGPAPATVAFEGKGEPVDIRSISLSPSAFQKIKMNIFKMINYLLTIFV